MRFIFSRAIFASPHLILTLIVFTLWISLRYFSPGFFLTDDNGNYFLGAYTHTYTSVVHHHTLPLINYHQHLGSPHLGQGQSAVFYPPLYLAFSLSQLLSGTTHLGIDLLILFHLILAALGMYHLLSARTPPYLAFLGSLFYICLPFVIGVSRIWVVMIYLTAYLPWNWYFLLRYLTKPTSSTLFGLIFVKTLLLLQGYVQWVVISVFFEFIFTLIYLRTHSSRPISSLNTFIPRLLFTWIMAALIAAPTLLPLWHTASRSLVRSGQVTLTDFLRVSVSLSSWLDAQLLKFHAHEIFDGSTFIFHLGIIPVLVFIYLTYKYISKPSTTKPILPFILLTIITLICSTELYAPAFHIPVLNWFRWPFKHLIFANFFFTLSLIYLLHKAHSHRPHLPILILTLSIVLNLFVVFSHLDTDTAFSRDRLAHTNPPPWLSTTSSTPGRILAFGIDPDKPRHQPETSTFNFASLYGFYSLGGYDATVSTLVSTETKRLPEFGTPNSKFSKDSINHMRAWGVRYWITDQIESADSFTKEHPDLIPIFTQDSTTIFADSQALPLVYWHDSTPADFTYHPDSISVITHDQSGLLTFNSITWPEYQAFADGQALPITVVDNRPTIIVPPHTTHIRLIYHSPHLYTGLIISALTLFLLLISLYPRSHHLLHPKNRR